MRKVEDDYGKAYKVITYACINLAHLTVILAQQSITLVTNIEGNKLWAERFLELTNRTLKSMRENVDVVQSLIEQVEKGLKR